MIVEPQIKFCHAHECKPGDLLLCSHSGVDRSWAVATNVRQDDDVMVVYFPNTEERCKPFAFYLDAADHVANYGNDFCIELAQRPTPKISGGVANSAGEIIVTPRGVELILDGKPTERKSFRLEGSVLCQSSNRGLVFAQWSMYLTVAGREQRTLLFQWNEGALS